MGSDSPPSWGLNDCGEQTGQPDIDAARDVPICAELQAQLPQGRSIHLLFLVGTQSKGVVKPRELYFAGLLGGGQALSFPNLSALATYVRRSQPR